MSESKRPEKVIKFETWITPSEVDKAIDCLENFCEVHFRPVTRSRLADLIRRHCDRANSLVVQLCFRLKPSSKTWNLSADEDILSAGTLEPSMERNFEGVVI